MLHEISRLDSRAWGQSKRGLLFLKGLLLAEIKVNAVQTRMPTAGSRERNFGRHVSRSPT